MTLKPELTNVFLNDDTLQFTLKSVDTTLANTLRRTILSDIETYVFKTYPYNECDATIEVNTTRFNNEIIKQRLSCVPIHIQDPEFPTDNFIVVVDEKNTSDTITYVTTEHFKLYDINTKTFMPQKEVAKIFPKNKLTNQYIDLVRLRPQISNEIPGEHLKFTCKISKSCAKHDSMFNVACNSSYGFTPDIMRIDETWNLKEKELRENTETSVDEIEYLKKDWYSLEAKRIYLKNSFDFTIQTVGVFSPYELVRKSCQIMSDEFMKFKNELTSNVSINESSTTLDNGFDVILSGKDHTFGKCIEYLYFRRFYEIENSMTYCGFQKVHPHDDYSILRIAYSNEVERDTIIQHLSTVCDEGIQLFKDMEQLFIE
jgi:DNA-directed RNA polymerase subunit L